MAILRASSHTRVTLALDLVRKLTEGPYSGYHELGILKHQITLCDEISVESSPEMRISCDHRGVPLDGLNLCWKAAVAVAAAAGIDEKVHIVLEKHIPVQGGLAGGSANAATVMHLVNELWECGFDAEELARIGRTVGMDVPFYFTGGTAFDTESTGIIEAVPTGLCFDLVLAVPDFGVSTRDAYGEIDYSKIGSLQNDTLQMREALAADDRERVCALMHNDFELSVFPKFPSLALLREKLRALGCAGASLSGSGSTLVGIARDADHALWVQAHLGESTCIVCRSL